MKFVKTKQCLFVGSALLLSAAVITGCALSAKTYRTAPTDTFTVSSNDGYYSETTYFLTEEAYKEHSMQTEENTQANRKTTLNASAPDADEGEFVLGAIQSIAVSETVAEDGSIADSHPMTENELEDYGINPASIGDGNDPWQNSTWGGGSSDPYQEVGRDNQSLYLLSINLVVKYYTTSKEYKIEGSASWEQKFTMNTQEAAEEFNFDFIGVTWGGNNTLRAISSSISGKYYHDLIYGDENVTFSRSASDSYAGYVWQFNEKPRIYGKEMEIANASVTLKKEGELQNRTTSARLTYIHTYGAIQGNISIGVNTNGELAADVSLSYTDKQWQIEIDVPGINF